MFVIKDHGSSSDNTHRYFSIYASSNQSDRARDATIAFKYKDKTIRVSITQSNAPTPELSIAQIENQDWGGYGRKVSGSLKDNSPTMFQEFLGAEGLINLTVRDPGGTMSAKANEDWIKITRQPRSLGDGRIWSLMIQPNENSSLVTRTGTVTITYGNTSRTVTIIQTPR